jgi:integrase
MAVDDLWMKRGPNGQKTPSKRHGRGKRWRVRNDGSPTVLFDRKTDAERHDANVRADLSRGQYINPNDGKITVAEYSDKWRTQQVHHDSTAESVERVFRLHIRPLLGDLTMAQVRASHLRSWVKDRSAPGVLAPSTLHLVWSYVASMFTDAVHDRVIGISPCGGVNLPRVIEAERYIPTVDEIYAVAAALPLRYRAAVWVSAGCGLRAQEVLGLELDSIDHERRELHVRQQIRQSKEFPRFLGRVKTATSRRILELPTVASEALAELVAAHPPTPRVMDDFTDPQKPTRREACLLFTSSGGTPLNRSVWSSAWRMALRRADAAVKAAAVERGEDPSKVGVTQGWGLHALRHFYATRLIHGGASVKTVQLALGHSKPSITLDTYTHEWPDMADRTRTLVDDALRR